MFNSGKLTADMPYVGRFAPSPTGPLHFGSLLAALASYLDAHSHNGRWLIRIENLDPPREMSGAVELILAALSTHGLNSDEDILYQSNRSEFYQAALDQLIQQQDAFPCQCSRKQLQSHNGIHLGICQLKDDGVFAWRFASESSPLIVNGQISFNDFLQGRFQQDLSQDIGDFVIKRKDQLWAYQLAMVVDDYLQGVSHVVRGIDLIDSTLRQNMLQTALGYPLPQYAHIPVAINPDGQKLSKQNHAPALDLQQPQENLWRALSWLRQEPPKELRQASVKELLEWGKTHWQLDKLQQIQSQPAV